MQTTRSKVMVRPKKLQSVLGVKTVFPRVLCLLTYNSAACRGHGSKMSSVSGLITARASNVGLALLDQITAESLGNNATLMEVGHELPRNLHVQAKEISASSCTLCTST